MSKSKKPTTQTQNVEADPFQSIDPTQLQNVAGGAARVTARGGTDPQLTAMLTQIGESIKGLANQKPDDGMSQMMMMMMMMGGMGGGGAPAPAPAPQQPLPPVINVTNSHRGC
ncbi:MAG: hypothetical protein AB7T06_29400 [Kofleriaceae bacterium]